MDLHPLPHRRVASPPLSPAIRNNRPAAASPRPWPNLPSRRRKHRSPTFSASCCAGWSRQKGGSMRETSGAERRGRR